ncbi:MAG: AAA family ATPase [Chthoniobacterales bacterium]|nr:AAA family ATPase [Chthoniobacterales bacterium]
MTTTDTSMTSDKNTAPDSQTSNAQNKLASNLTPYGRSPHLRSYAARCEATSGNLHLEITDIATFSDDYNRAPLPVLLHYGARPLHRLCIPSDSWDIEKMREELRAVLIRGDASYASGAVHRKDLVFGTRQGTFVHYDDGSLKVYASSPRRVILAAMRLKRYMIKVDKTLPSFHLLRKCDDGLSTQKVDIKDFEPLDNEGLDLHYGSGFADWSDRLKDKLKSKNSGIVIMEGEPGTGKSTYLKSLIANLMDTHRFYFLQPHYAGIISEPSFVGFWMDQSRQHEDKKFVIILEDSEKCLMRREDDNRSEVSSLLQITDGLMGSFMKLQVLCTINCQATQLDPALLRPGRLLARKVFGRLSREEAKKVADKLGKPMPEGGSISLAELYNDAVEEPEVQSGKILGFAA